MRRLFCQTIYGVCLTAHSSIHHISAILTEQYPPIAIPKMIFNRITTQNCFLHQRSKLRSIILGKFIVILNFVGRFRNFVADALLDGGRGGVSLGALRRRGVSESAFCGDLVYRFRKKVGNSNFSEQYGGRITRYKRIGYSLDIMRRTACLIVGPVIVGGCTSLFDCMAAVRASDSMVASSWNFGQWVEAWRCVFGLAHRGSAVGFHFLWHAVELAMSTRLSLLLV